MALTNKQLWDEVRRINPTFASHTSQATSDLFSERGYSELNRNDPNIINQFYMLSLRVVLDRVDYSNAKDPLLDNGFGEVITQDWGGITQRIAINSVKPISPSYRTLDNGDSPDPFVVRKPTMSERFFESNFDYQSLITDPDEWQRKELFISEYGVYDFVAGIFKGLENGYILQRYVNKLECLNQAINDVNLQTTQTKFISISDTPTESELVDFIRTVMNTIELMTTAAQTDAYNAMRFASTQNKDSLRLLVRPGYRADLALDVVRGSYNADTLALDVPVITVPHFGGLVPYADESLTTRVYPVYNALGEEIGFAPTQNATTPTVTKPYYKDPNEDVFAVLADRACIFETLRNPYIVEPIRNPRGRYQNYWASAPNNGIHYDRIYNLVKFVNASATPAVLSTKSTTKSTKTASA